MTARALGDVCKVGVAAFALLSQTCPALAQTLAPGRLPAIARVDERFQSYNVEMLSVTGGRFWKPYGSTVAGLYQERPPLALDNPRLVALAAALGPAYMRVSGTWANATWLSGPGQSEGTPPPGYSGVLTRERWKLLVEFAGRTNAGIVTSFAVSPGTRDASGAWTSSQAAQLIDITRALGAHIAAAEFMNEPTLAPSNGPPPGYDATAYGRDFAVFSQFVRTAAPDMMILGPGSVGGTVDAAGEHDVGAPSLKARDLLAASLPHRVDVLSYHHYGALSQRCATSGGQTLADDALSEQWLSRTDGTAAFYRAMRDAFAPGKPIWLTETADAACGGNPWAKTFRDTFRYLDQLGRLAKQDVKVVMHNTLVWSDYGLLDEVTFVPRPNYWAAWLWHRFMGATVLDGGVRSRHGLHLYAHCLHGSAGGVALLALNTSLTESVQLAIDVPGEGFTMTASTLDSSDVTLNGRQLSLGADDAFPALAPEVLEPGHVELAPRSISFMVFSGAENPNCR